ncbi:MAG: hypothetical protein ACFFCP_06050 [Promethearchaeota archaeon]
MNSEEEDTRIIFNPEAAKSLCFKTVALLAIIFLPLVFIYWFQGLLRPLFGAPSPFSTVYQIMFVLLIVWYVFGFGILLPLASRHIDVYLESRAHGDNDSE